MKLQLDQLCATMRELEGKTQDASEEMHDNYQAAIGTLRQQSQMALDRLAELKDAGEDSWEDLVVGTEKLRDSLVRSFHYFKT